MTIGTTDRGTERIGRNPSRPASLLLFAFCFVILAWTAIAPVSDALRLREINPNEGWNVSNAQKVAEHRPLYPATDDWTPVNYPALSFHLAATLHRLTGDYLFTARILSMASLCVSGILVGLIVAYTGRSRFAAWMSGLLLVGIFCANARGYVGMDDPQMFAQVFFLAGLYVYAKGNRQGWVLEASALLFVLGGNFKHNLIEFPLAVFLDLLFSSPRRALRFAAGGLLMASISVLLTSWIDGAGYVSALLAPRAYSASRAFHMAWLVLKPILLPALAALWMAIQCWKNPSQRVLALLLICALAANTFFCGGYGVWINGMFGSMLAIVLLTGIFFAEFPALPLGPLRRLPAAAVYAAFFLWLAVPMRSWGIGWTPKGLESVLASSRANESRFAIEVAFLRQQPGSAICESPLRCFYAGKPWLYDAFNAPRLMSLGRLDPGVMVEHLRDREYGAIQLTGTIEGHLAGCKSSPQCVPAIFQAIEQNYRPAFENKDGVIYLPLGRDEQPSPKPAGIQ